jgi:serine/threonine protein kinase
MPSPADPPAATDFTTTVLRLQMLTADAAGEITAAISVTGTSPAQEALRRGMIDAAQADVVETLLRPHDTVPGYEILDLLGRGGMGVVYRARQVALDRIVALKTILLAHLGNETAIQRFEREARAVARLSHPHIVAAYDCGRSAGRVWFAMELVEGTDAQRRLQERGTFDERTTWGIVRQAAAGLAHAAEQGLVHRDIKPANLLLVDAPAGFPLPAGMPLVKIADFGLARGMDPADEPQLTATNMAVGTPAYMAPEQLQGAAAGPAADTFSLGVTAFALLTGRTPHAGRTLPQIVAEHLRGAVPRLRDIRPDVTPATDDLVAALMQPDPRLRLNDYRRLLAAIDGLSIDGRRAAATPGASPAAAGRAADPSLTPTVDLVLPATTRDAGAAHPDRPSDIRHHRLGSTWQLAALGFTAVALLVWPFIAARRSAPPRDLVRSGRATALFDGTDMTGWTTHRGGWSITHDDEGAPVLVGRGTVARAITLAAMDDRITVPDHYALSCVVERHTATAVEVRFDLPSSQGPLPCLTVQIDAEGATVGERSGDGEARRLAGPFSLDEQTAPRHAIGIERHMRGWWIEVDGRTVATTSFLHESPAAEIQLDAGGGEARFSDVILEELVPAPRRDAR